MTAQKTLALCLLLWAALGQTALGAPFSWSWTSWSPSEGMVVTNLSGPNPFTSPETAPFTPSPQPMSIIIPAPSPPALPAPAPSVVSNPDPYAWQNLGRWAATSPVATYVPASVAPASLSNAADAYVNMGAGPYPGATQLTTGAAEPWWNSPVTAQLFGGMPDAQQRADFTSTVLKRVEQTYQLSGVPLHLTSDPADATAHTLSVVSHTTYGPNPNVVGITNQGGDGFSFIDKFGPAQSVDQLEWLVAHNVAHELMHAFGADHHDTSGSFLDAALTPWSLMIDPGARFSTAAAQDLLAHNFHVNSDRPYSFDGQMLCSIPAPSPVPEPFSLALWCVVAMALGVRQRRRWAIS